MVTNRTAKDRKGAYGVMVKGTVSKNVIDILGELPEEIINNVEEITIDLIPTMKLVAK